MSANQEQHIEKRVPILEELHESVPQEVPKELRGSCNVLNGGTKDNNELQRRQLRVGNNLVSAGLVY